MVKVAVSRKVRQKEIFGVLIILGAGCLSNSALAEPVRVTGDLSTRHSDNIGKTNVAESGTETAARIGIRHSSGPGQCRSDLDASLGYSYWLNDFYDPEATARAGFNGNCQIRPGLNWQLSDNLSEVLQSSRENDTPENRTRKNIFRTGPVLTIPLSEVDQLRASASFENTEYEDPESRDSKGYTASLGWNHLFDTTLSGGLSASANRQELDNGAETDSESININMNKTWATSSLNASVGVTQQKNSFGNVEQTSEGLVGSLRLDREINPSASFYLSASRQITDQASDFTIRFDDVAFDYTQETGVEVTAIELGLNKRFSDGTRFEMGIFANQSDYLQSDQREESLGLRFSVARNIRPQLSIRGGGSYEYLRYEQNQQDDQLASASIGLNYQLTRDLDCAATIGHRLRQSDLPASQYNENWIQIGLSYRFL